MRRRRLRISAEVMAHFLPPLQRMLIPYAASGLSVAISVAMPAPWTEKKLADSNPDPLFMTLALGGRGAWGIQGGGGVECRWRRRGRGAAMEALHEPGPRLLAVP